MFGLDARIALVIFGALSVISGAALYSAIKESRVVSILATISEVEKAIEQYILDTGEDLPLYSLTTTSTAELVVSSNVSWQGPYLSYSPITTSTATEQTQLYHSEYERIVIDRAPLRDFSSSVSVGSCDDVANADYTCFYWAFLGSVDLATVKKIDLKVDGVESNTQGSIRYDGLEPSKMYKKLFPVIKQ